jgi:biopolymer transport protein ExbD
MKFRRTSHDQGHGMNLVPLIDVLLILLIFFIVNLAMAKFETEVNISVPAADSGKQNNRTVGELVVNIREDGTRVLNSQVLTDAELKYKFDEIAKFDRKQAIIIRADTRTEYGDMFRVLDLCHQAGLYHVSFATREAEAPAAP